MKRQLAALALVAVCLSPEQMAELREMLRQQAYRANCWATGGTVIETEDMIDCLEQPASDEEA